MSMSELEYLQKQRDLAKTPEQLEKARRAMDEYWFPKKKKVNRRKDKNKKRKMEFDDKWIY